MRSIRGRRNKVYAKAETEPELNGQPSKTFNPGDRVAIVAESVRAKEKKVGRILEDYGRFVLVQMKHYKECFYKEDLKEAK
jgi:hypothetical protein